MKDIIRPGISLFILLSVLTGIAYPVLTTAVAKPISRR